MHPGAFFHVLPTLRHFSSAKKSFSHLIPQKNGVRQAIDERHFLQTTVLKVDRSSTDHR